MGKELLAPEEAERLAALMRAIAHPVRLRVLSFLRLGEANVTQISERLGVPQAVISNQLSILRMNGVVNVRRGQGFAWYSINETRVLELLRCLSGAEKAAGFASTGGQDEG